MEKNILPIQLLKTLCNFYYSLQVEQYHLVLVRSNGSTANQLINFSCGNSPILVNRVIRVISIITNPVCMAVVLIITFSNMRITGSSDSGGNFNVKIIDIHDWKISLLMA